MLLESAIASLVKHRLPSVLVLLTIGATSIPPVAASDEIPFQLGTYAQKKEWCSVDRSSVESPDNEIEGAFINLSESRIFISEAEAEILSVSVEGSEVSFTVNYSIEGDESEVELVFYRKSSTEFVHNGLNYTRCKKYLPNPWFGQ